MLQKIRIMRTSDLRRALLILPLLCGVLMMYFFLQEPYSAAISNVQEPKRETKDLSVMKMSVQWSWKCVKGRCKKELLSMPTQSLQSITTCNMLCGDPQLWPAPSGPTKIGRKAIAFSLHQLEPEISMREPALTFLQLSFSIFNNNIASYIKKKNASPIRSNIRKFIIKISVSYTHVVKLRMNTDESYNLTMNARGKDIVALVNAKTVFGARHGLESLSQLIWWDELDSGGILKVIKEVKIHDRPVFPYRGILLDTSRNFMSVTSIKRVFDGMAANKLNVFHWHVSDSHSFPLEIPSVPQMHMSGSYQRDMVYRVKDVKELVEYARHRGIRIVIEIDTPAHVGSGWTWGPEEGLGELAVCVNSQPWYKYCAEPPCGQLNPMNPQVYKILERIYRDIIKMTGEDEIFHIGGDEVNLDCWDNFLYNNLTNTSYLDLNDLWGNFTLEILNRLEKANGGKKPLYIIAWSSELSQRPYSTKYFDKKNIIIQSWGSNMSETHELIADGYNVILSHFNAWYLNTGFGPWTERGGGGWDAYKPWQTVYLHQPWGFDKIYKSQTLGAEACLWSEQVDELSIDSRLWPRAAAFAERVWSDPKMENYEITENVYTRLSMQRDRMLARGFGGEALWPQWCTQNPGMCL